jgi:Tol biopolymer transport system component
LTAGDFGQVDVMNTDGSARKTIFDGERRTLFGLSWSKQPEQVAFSHGVAFSNVEVPVRIVAVSPDAGHVDTLTDGTGNDAFPAYSPDGKQIVFRSGRDGAKNLYIMDRNGDNVRRLTNGDWTDTMAEWSPRGEWISFSGDRDDDFEIWLIRPDGTGLRKLIGGGGRNTHPHFSPDGNWIVFASQRAGYSAEEVSMPRQPQPYGELFIVRVDGTGLIRLTHNGTEEGTPAWGAVTNIEPSEEASTIEGEF